MGSSVYREDTEIVDIVMHYCRGVCFYADAYGESLSADTIETALTSWEKTENDYDSNGIEIRNFFGLSINEMMNNNTYSNIYCVVFSPVNNIIMETELVPHSNDNIGDVIISTFRALITDLYLKLIEQIIPSHDLANYKMHLKYLELPLTSAIKRVLLYNDANSDSYGLVVRGVKISFRVVSTNGESMIIPSTIGNMNDFARKEIFEDDIIEKEGTSLMSDPAYHI
jgi:hypothetical protein